MTATDRNGPEFAKKQENTEIGPTSAALVLWKPHPEEARSAVSKDEASDCFALMLRDAARVRAAPQHEGGRSAAALPIRTLGQEVFKIAPPAATTYASSAIQNAKPRVVGVAIK